MSFEQDRLNVDSLLVPRDAFEFLDATQAISKLIKNKMIFELYEPAENIEIDRVCGEFVSQNDLEPVEADDYTYLWRSMCGGANVAKIIVAFSRHSKELHHLPNLSTMTGKDGGFTIDQIEAWAEENPLSSELSVLPAFQLACDVNVAVQTAETGRYAANLIMLQTELQIRDRMLGTFDEFKF